MRIISGTARGRTIVAPAGDRTRPTQDKVRESLFNIIRWDVMDARVLDLFAGTGALSLESLSRGAKSAVMIDTDRAACEAIKKNIAACRMEDKARLIVRDYRQAIDQLASIATAPQSTGLSGLPRSMLTTVSPTPHANVAHTAARVTPRQ